MAVRHDRAVRIELAEPGRTPRSGAKVIGLANAGTDTVTAVRQLLRALGSGVQDDVAVTAIHAPRRLPSTG